MIGEGERLRLYIVLFSKSMNLAKRENLFALPIEYTQAESGLPSSGHNLSIPPSQNNISCVPNGCGKKFQLGRFEMGFVYSIPVIKYYCIKVIPFGALLILMADIARAHDKAVRNGICARDPGIGTIRNHRQT